MINKLRNEIELIDSEILKLISRRITAVKKLKIEKVNSGLLVKDNLREKILLIRWRKKGKQAKLRNGYVIKLFRLVISESRRIQNEK